MRFAKRVREFHVTFKSSQRWQRQCKCKRYFRFLDDMLTGLTPSSLLLFTLMEAIGFAWLSVASLMSVVRQSSGPPGYHLHIASAAADGPKSVVRDRVFGYQLLDCDMSSYTPELPDHSDTEWLCCFPLDRGDCDLRACSRTSLQVRCTFSLGADRRL